LASALVALTLLWGCESDGRIVVLGHTRVLEKPLPEDLYKGIVRGKDEPPIERPKLVAVLDSGTTVRLLKTEYMKEYAAYRIELRDGRRGYVFSGDSIEILGGVRAPDSAVTVARRIYPSLGKPIYGRWRVVAFDCPWICGLTPAEAKKWIGRVAYFSDTLVAFAGDRCASPKYVLDTTSGDEFLMGFRVRPAELGLGDTVVSTVIRCPGAPNEVARTGDWIARGSLVYHRGPELLTPWDGIFFVLRRQ
jgi:hypothetical protein